MKILQISTRFLIIFLEITISSASSDVFVHINDTIRRVSSDTYIASQAMLELHNRNPAQNASSNYSNQPESCSCCNNNASEDPQKRFYIKNIIKEHPQEREYMKRSFTDVEGVESSPSSSDTVTSDTSVINILEPSTEKRSSTKTSSTTIKKGHPKRKCDQISPVFNMLPPRYKPASRNLCPRPNINTFLDSLKTYIKTFNNVFPFYNAYIPRNRMNNVWTDFISNDPGMYQVYCNMISGFKRSCCSQFPVDVLNVSELMNIDLIEQSNLYLKFTSLEGLLSGLWSLESPYISNITYLSKFCVSVMRRLVNIPSVSMENTIQKSELTLLHTRSFCNSFLLSMKETYSISSILNSIYNSAVNSNNEILQDAISYFSNINRFADPMMGFFTTLKHAMALFKNSEVLKKTLISNSKGLRNVHLHRALVKQISKKFITQFEVLFNPEITTLISNLILGLRLFAVVLPEIENNLLAAVEYELSVIEQHIQTVIKDYVIPHTYCRGDRTQLHTLRENMNKYYASPFDTKMTVIKNFEDNITNHLRTFLENDRSNTAEAVNEKYRVYMRIKILKEIILGFDYTVTALQGRFDIDKGCYSFNLEPFNYLLFNIFDPRLVMLLVDGVMCQYISSNGVIQNQLKEIRAIRS